MTELTKCYDIGCGWHDTCARFEGIDPEYNTLISLFPYDQPLSDPCPHYVDRDNLSRGEK